MNTNAKAMYADTIKMAVEFSNRQMAESVERFSILSMKYGKMVSALEPVFKHRGCMPLSLVETATITMMMGKFEAIGDFITSVSKPYLEAFEPLITSIKEGKDFDKELLKVVEIYCDSLFEMTDDFEEKNKHNLLVIDAVSERAKEEGLI